MICEVANILKNCFRETDIVARIGGDEFIAIVKECDLQIVNMFKNRIKEAILLNNTNGKRKNFNISISFGYAVAENKDDTIGILMQKADRLMYENKNSKIKSN